MSESSNLSRKCHLSANLRRTRVRQNVQTEGALIHATSKLPSQLSLLGQMDNDQRRNSPSFGAALTVPELHGRADILGASPICVGGTRSLTLNQARGRSPNRLNVVGMPLYSRSRAASESRSPSPHQDTDCLDDEELRNLARQPSTADSLVQDEIRRPSYDNRETITESSETFGNCSCASTFTPHMEDMFRRKLKFHFMNPCQKWRSKKRFPFKLSLQLLKIVIVTAQLMYFGTERSGYVDFVQRNNLALNHLYVKGWDPSFETLPYPPATGEFAVYEIDQLLDGIDYALTKYNLTKIVAIGSYDFTDNNGSIPEPELCVTKFAEGRIWPHNQSYSFNATIVRDCFDVPPVQFFNTTTNKTEERYDIRKFFDQTHRHIYFDRLNQLEVKFSLKTVHLKIQDFDKMTQADCFQFNVTILYDNSKHNGQVPVTLQTLVIRLQCREGKIVHGASPVARITKRVLDLLVILVGTISFFLCLRTLYRSNRLKRMTVHYFKVRFNRELTMSESAEFLNLWDILILLNDVLTVTGTVVKILIELRDADSYEVAGMLLGVGNLLVWLGVLRYLSFFEHYNILILTMKQAIPDVGRFLVCATVLYLGFAFCGWIVLGPYHIKFATISQASECLFALVNGDEIFVTYADTRVTNNYIYYFSRVYLYLFISLFMYVVYSLFTSIIITTYETIKFYYREGFPKSGLQAFIDEYEEDDSSPLFLADDRTHRGCLCCLLPCFSCLKCCRKRERDSFPDEFTPLINS